VNLEDGRILVKWMFKKWDGEAWTGLIWLRIEIGSVRFHTTGARSLTSCVRMSGETYDR